MHKYSSFYLSEVLNGIHKNAYIGQGAVNAGADIAGAVAPGAAAQIAASKYIPKGIPAGGFKGLGAGLVATTALDTIAPKFNNDSYWGQVGNELRSFGVNTAGASAGAAAVTGGAAALPGAIQGAAFDVGNKLWRVGSGLNSLFNPYSEHNKSIAEGKERNARLDKQYQERMANRKPKPPAATPIAQPVANMGSVSPPAPPIQPTEPPITAPDPTPSIPPVAANTGSIAPAATPTALPAATPVAVAPPATTPLPAASPVSAPSPDATPSNNLPPASPVAVPPPVTTTPPASSPVSVPTPLTSPSNNLTPKQRMDKITVDRNRAQRDKALEYAGLDPKSPPKQFSGFVPPAQQPAQQPAATNSFLPRVNSQAPQPKPVAQPPAGASNPQKFNVVKTPHGTAVGGNVFDKLKAEGKVPKDFQLTKAMRTGEEALPPEIQKAKDEFLRSAKATS